MTAPLDRGDIDRSGKADVIISFPGQGIWSYMSDANWMISRRIGAAARFKRFPSAVTSRGVDAARDEGLGLLVP